MLKRPHCDWWTNVFAFTIFPAYDTLYCLLFPFHWKWKLDKLFLSLCYAIVDWILAFIRFLTKNTSNLVVLHCYAVKLLHLDKHIKLFPKNMKVSVENCSPHSPVLSCLVCRTGFGKPDDTWDPSRHIPSMYWVCAGVCHVPKKKQAAVRRVALVAGKPNSGKQWSHGEREVWVLTQNEWWTTYSGGNRVCFFFFFLQAP